MHIAIKIAHALKYMKRQKDLLVSRARLKGFAALASHVTQGLSYMYINAQSLMAVRILYIKKKKAAQQPFISFIYLHFPWPLSKCRIKNFFFLSII